jgi:Leucine-rich repeat (LRR) protein
VTVLPAWEKDCALVHINGSYNKLTKLDSLAGYMNLNTVVMDYNNIKVVNVLADCPFLIRVDVSGNPVRDVSKLTEMDVIVNYTP